MLRDFAEAMSFGTADDGSESAPSVAEEFCWLNESDILEGTLLETMLEEPRSSRASRQTT